MSATEHAHPEPQYPIIKYAAVEHVQYALTDDHHPEASWKRGGVMLAEVIAGKFIMLVTGSQYSATVDLCNMTTRMDIFPDIKRREVRWSLWTTHPYTVKSWTYVRFGEAHDFTKFTRELFAAFDVVSERANLISTRVHEIAFNTPSNFTKYCRQYLGQDYFDNLVDSEDGQSDRSGSPDTQASSEDGEDETLAEYDSA